MKNVKVLLLTVSLIMLSGCSDERWEGFVYPNANNLSNSLNIGEFPSLDACRNAATDRLAAIGALYSGDYECGLNCEANAELGNIKICEKTER
jgi:hypothetical protein